jgi:chromosome segregation ATPase
MDEEVVLLEEQLAAAQADIDQLQARLADAEASTLTREGELADVRRQLEAARQDIATRDASLASQIEELASTRGSLADAEARSRNSASRYREIVLSHEPDLPADLVSGETVTEIDEALARARQTVAQVRQHIEQQAQVLRVPTGAPTRGSPDLSSLTPSEKIRLGLQQA